MYEKFARAFVEPLQPNENRTVPLVAASAADAGVAANMVVAVAAIIPAAAIFFSIM
ncbi:hypothetical protein [Nocardiopsis gilva]|uniref:hypothetical protein n=1 Tax=Nocardiopsis gilva TaxID=280236 RepID=UPI0039EF61B6